MSDDRPEPGERIFYIRDNKGQPVACLAYRDSDDGLVRYGLSTLHPNDRFDRSLARKIALGRLRIAPDVVRPPEGARPLFHIIERLSHSMAVPGRLRKMITRRIKAYVEAKAE